MKKSILFLTLAISALTSNIWAVEVAPGAPTALSATCTGSGQVSIAFTAGTNTGSAITNYKYSTDNGQSYTACSPTQTTSPIVISGLTNNTTYSIKILAFNTIDGVASSTVTASPYGGTGTSGDPYLLSNPAHLIELKNIVNNAAGATAASANYKLTQDINLTGYTWTTSIGSYNYPFKGSFDGQGYKVTGIVNGTSVSRAAYNTAGFFGSIDGAKISNLSIDVSFYIVMTPATSNTGPQGSGLVVATAGTGNILINNCSVAGTIDVLANSPSASIAQSNCRAGGIICTANSTSPATITVINSSVNASITVKNDATSNITSSANATCAGIVGDVYSQTGLKVEVVNCMASGSVSAISTTYSSNVGGIVSFYSSTNTVINIINCIAYNTVNGVSKTTTTAGGIVNNQVNASSKTQYCIELNSSISTSGNGTATISRIGNKTAGTFGSNYANATLNAVGTKSADLQDGADLGSSPISDAISKLNGYLTNNPFTSASTATYTMNSWSTLALSASSVAYNGSAQAATVIGTGGIVSNVKYNGSATVPTNAGSYSIIADFKPTYGTAFNTLLAFPVGTYTITKANPTLSLSTSSVTYNASPQTATVTASVAGAVPSNVKYNGSATVPTNAGSYPITADFTPTDGANYNSLSSASAGTFTINPATPTVTVTPIGTYTYNNSPQGPSAVTTASGGTVTFSYVSVDGTTYPANVLQPTNAGNYTVTASVAANGNYGAASSSAYTFTINKATPTLTVSNTPVTFDGSTHSASVNGSVAGTASNVKYDGSSSIPTAVGSYAVTADFAPTDVTNYSSLTGASAGTFSINATVPDAPTIGTATAGDAQVSVAFTPPSNNGGSSIIDYTVTPYNGVTAGTPVTGSGSPIIVSSLANGTAYTFTVTARNGVGSSSASSASNSATPAASSSVITVSSNSNLSSYSPTSASDVTVNPGYELTVNADANVKTITVAPGAKLTLSSGTLTVATTNGITLQNTGSGTASFIDSRADVSTAIAGTVNQAITETNRNWYVSVPVAGILASDITLSGAKIVKRNEATVSWDDVTGSLTAGLGYIAVGSSTGGSTTWSLAGNLNSGQVQVDVTNSGASFTGFNLLGNPYPSYLNWEQVLNLNSTNATLLQPTIWYRTASYNSGTSKFDYTFNTYNSTGRMSTPSGTTGYIPPMQAFWVRANSGGKVIFTNDMRSHGNGVSNMLKVPSANNTTQQVLRLQVSNGTNVDETVIYTNTNASNGLDAFDSPKMSNNSASIPEIFTTAGTEKLVINGMNGVTPNQEIPLGFTTGQSNAFSIKATEVSNFDAGTQIILNDNQTNTQWNLSDGSAYNFSSDITSSNTSRLSIVFKAPSITTGNITNDSESNSMLVYRNADNLITINCVKGITGHTNASVYNAIGQKLEEKILTSSITVLDNSFTAGVYVVSVTTNGKTSTQKVVIK